MNTKKICVFAARENQFLLRFVMTERIFVIILFYALLLGFGAKFASAQTSNFYQTGQIRTIISETETENSAWKDPMHDAGFKSTGSAKSRREFYFTYSAFEGGKFTEKWIALPQDKVWNRLSNQTVRAKGSLKNNKLLNANVSPVIASSENYQSSPSPTVGLYKVVAVPLTIQPLSAQGKPDKNAPALTVTPEAIRNNLFNLPNSVNKFYLEASYGKFGFTGVNQTQAEVVPVTIQATVSTNCQEQIVTEFTPTVRQRLREQNIDTTNGSVDLGIIIFNDTPGCPNYPFATRGALGQRGAPQWLWIPESWFVTGPQIMTHEIGHVLGGNHPAVLRCANFDDQQTCVLEAEAADRDFMASGGRFNQMPNNYERRRWGWHPPGAFDNPSSGFVQMFDLHSPILLFVKDSVKRGRFYFRNLTGTYAGYDIYPEARRNWGQFEKYQEADESFRRGIAVRIGHSNYTDPEALSILIDPNNTSQSEDAPLLENQKVSIGGVQIECTRKHNPNWGTRMKVQ
jgi:hypothetical protein